jgi:hypothetical protein
MELVLGPFDPALHVRSRDHYEAVRREAQLLDLQPEAPPHRLEELHGSLFQELVDVHVDPVVDAAYLARAPSFTAHLVIPDERLPEVAVACRQYERLLEELDAWAHDSDLAILEAGQDVKEYRAAFLAQLRGQLEAPAH